MFTQKISMNCTQEQYEKYLKDELLKMGYDSDWLDIDCLNVIVNNYAGKLGEVTNTDGTRKTIEGRTYLGSFNAPLFLALAAMTDRKKIATYGELLVFKPNGKNIELWQKNIERNTPYNPSWYKATKEEIMEKFGKDKAAFPTSTIDITTNSDKKWCYYVSEEHMIAILKSKGYKILKPKTWEEV